MIPCRSPRLALVCRCAAIVFLTLLAPRESCFAQAADAAPSPGADLALIYNIASTAFAAGKYAEAVAGLEKVVAEAPPDSKLESVYFLLGASYFNLAQYPKAIEKLRFYITKYPQSARIAEVNYSLGVACLLTHDNAGAAQAFQTLEKNTVYREPALLYEGTALKDSGKPEEAIVALEKLVTPGIHSNNMAQGGLMLAGLYAEKKEVSKAVALIAQIRQNIGLLDNVAQLNVLTIQAADALLQQSLPEEALALYRGVFPRAEVIRLLNERIAAHQAEILRQIAAVRADPAHASQLLATLTQTRTALAETTQQLAEFQKLPEYQPGLLVRMAACFAQMRRRWEAIVVYSELLRLYPNDAAVNEPALYGLITNSTDVGRIDKTRALCEQYLKEFPQGANTDSVGYLTGALALQADDPKGAETYFGRAIKTQPQSSYKETMVFLVGNAQFALGEYDKAQETYAKYAADYPQGERTEEAVYRTALCDVFAGAYEKALGHLQDYEKVYPKGDFIEDADYRIGMCKYAASLYDEVVADMQAWEKKYRKGQLLGEVLALEGDAVSAKGDNQAAAALYIRSSQVAATTEVSDYSLFAAQKLLQKLGDWPRMSEMFKEFVRAHPDRPSAVMAVFWIGKAEARQGKTEEAKRFIADTIKKYIADPQRDAVEQLLTQLATLCVHKSPPAPVPTPAATLAAAGAGSSAPGPTPSPASTPAPAEKSVAVDPGAELDALLGSAETKASPLARARVLFAKSELARLRRQTDVQDRDLEAIATGFKPEDLSAPLLALTGDYLLGKGRLDQAAVVFEDLKTNYPKSNQLDFAYNGLAEIAYQQKKYPEALRLFTDAVDKAGAAAKLKEVTVGRAKTLLAMGRLDEAKAVFDEVASTREWRGESTAFAIYSLGDIMRQQNKLPEAVAYYQRVYVAYQRYLPWVAKAYVASAECFEQMGKTDEARNTYREMLRNPKLDTFSEAEVARDHLQKIGQG